jgi:two-component system OmpR family response regulator
MHHHGKVISKTELTEHIYGQDFDRDSNVIEVLINRLRRKLGSDLIKTHRGQGYQLIAPEDAS